MNGLALKLPEHTAAHTLFGGRFIHLDSGCLTFGTGACDDNSSSKALRKSLISGLRVLQRVESQAQKVYYLQPLGLHAVFGYTSLRPSEIQARWTETK